MATRLKSTLAIISIIAVTVLFYDGCGAYVPPAITGSPPNFIGLGSLWELNVDTAASWVLVNHSTAIGAGTDYTGLGPYSTYTATGLTKVSISEVDLGSDGPAAGASTFGLYVTNSILFWAPFTTAGSILGFVPYGTCPSDTTANWIKLRQPAGWAIGLGNGDAFGTMTYTAATSVSAVVNDYNLDIVANSDSSTDMGPQALSTSAGCGGGIVTDGTTDTVTSSNAILIHKLSTDAMYFAWPNAAAPAATALAGNYGGVIYASAGLGTNSPATLTLATSGPNVTGTMTIVSDITTGASAGGTNPTITLGSETLPAPLSGFIGGTINFTGTNDPLVCLPVAGIGGTTANLLVCVGTDDANDFYSVVLLSH